MSAYLSCLDDGSKLRREQRRAAIGRKDRVQVALFVRFFVDSKLREQSKGEGDGEYVQGWCLYVGGELEKPNW